MSILLRSKLGKTFSTSAGHWAVYLYVAQCYGWKPIGTSPPIDWPASKTWHGQYGTNDGQTVTHDEALLLAKVLHSAAAGPQIGQALEDCIRHVESSVEQSGTPISDVMRMHPQDFSKEFSPLLFLLYDGEFTIE